VFGRLEDMVDVVLSEGSPYGIGRRVNGFKVVAYDGPQGCCAASTSKPPPLLPDERSNIPAAKRMSVL